MTSAKTLFTDEQQKQIVNAVKRAENETSGEIRVYIEENCTGEVLDRAAFIFEQLEMHKTDARNGVLFYVATNPRKFAIIGDAGINAAVPPGFWDEIKNHIITNFKEGRYTEGLSEAVDIAGNALKLYFPHASDDKNELSDDIVFGEDDNA